MLSTLTEPFKLVMIEDDEGHALLIQKNLKRAGIANTIVHLSDGSMAVDYFFSEKAALQDHEKTLILLDLNLPHIDGYEILSKLKADERTKRIPVIILTTTDNPKEIDHCYELGCNVYIIKPVEYDNFSEAIRKLGLMLAVVKVPHSN